MSLDLIPKGFAFSQSSLQDYLDCPRRFQLRYLDKVKWPAVMMEPVHEAEQHQQQGQQFHRLLQQHFLGIPSEKLAKMTTNPMLSLWFQNFLECKLDLEGATTNVEVSLSTPVGSFWLVAKYDLLAIHAGQEAIIYDWKTYQRRPTDQRMESRMQTRLYQALLVQAGATIAGGIPCQPWQVKLIYWYANFPNQPARFQYSDQKFKTDWNSLTTLIQEVAATDHFPLTLEEQKCEYCTFNSLCNRRSGVELSDDLLDLENPQVEDSIEQTAEAEF